MNFLPEKDTILLSLIDMEMRRPHINYQSHKSAPYQWGPFMKRAFIIQPYADKCIIAELNYENLLLKRKLQGMAFGVIFSIAALYLLEMN